MIKLSKVVLVIIALLCNVWLTEVTASTDKEVALVVSAPNWHYEVVNFLTCALKESGLRVHAWINPDNNKDIDVKFVSMCAEKVLTFPAGGKYNDTHRREFAK